MPLLIQTKNILYTITKSSLLNYSNFYHNLINNNNKKAVMIYRNKRLKFYRFLNNKKKLKYKLKNKYK